MLRTRVPVEVVRQRIVPAVKRHYSGGPVRIWAAGGRDLLSEVDMWVKSLSGGPTQQVVSERESNEHPARPAEPIRAVMPPPLAQTIEDTRHSWEGADSSHNKVRDPITGRALPTPSAPLTA
jgi:hypothetical protein